MMRTVILTAALHANLNYTLLNLRRLHVYSLLLL